MGIQLSKPNVYVTRQLFPEAIEILERHSNVEVFDGIDNAIPRDLLLEKVKKIKQDSSWVDSTQGKAFKMVSQLLYDLPVDRNYKIIFLRRNMQEILASQRKMLQRQSSYNDSEDDEKMGKLFEKHLTEIEGWLKAQKNMGTIYINYNDVIEHPRRNAQRVNKFLDYKLNVMRK